MRRLIYIAIASLLLAGGFVLGQIVQLPPASAQVGGGSRYFPETGHSVGGRFLEYWLSHGGLAQQGYPLTDEFREVSDLNGREYTVQYFERAVFEYHPEYSPPNDVLLSQLGTLRYREKYPNGVPGAQRTPLPTATSVGDGKLEVLDYTTYSLPNGGGLRVVGVAKNTGAGPLGEVEIEVRLVDSGGRVVAKQGIHGPVAMLPNDVWPFNVTFARQNPAFSRVEFSLTFEMPLDYDLRYAYRDYQLTNMNVMPANDVTGAGVLVMGDVANIGTSTAIATKVYVLVTDAAGKVLDTEEVLAERMDLAPGERTQFRAQMTTRQAPNVKTFIYGRKR